MTEGPETDRLRHSIESVLGSSGVRVGGESCQILQTSLESLKNLPESAKPSRTAPKIAEISLELLESRRISPNMVEILLRPPRMSPDLTKSRLDLLKCRRISLNLA